MTKGICKRILKSNLLDDDKIDLIKLIGIFEAKALNSNNYNKEVEETEEDYDSSDEKIDIHLMNKTSAIEAIEQFQDQICEIAKLIKTKKKTSKLYNDNLDVIKSSVKKDLIDLLTKALDQQIDNPDLESMTEEDEDLKVVVSDIKDGGFQLVILAK